MVPLKVLSTAYPLSNLKTVKESVGLDINDVFIGIDKIKKHRIKNGENEYLVEWKGLTEEENTWVTKAEITQEELDNYNKRKTSADIEISEVRIIKQLNYVSVEKRNQKIKT